MSSAGRTLCEACFVCATISRYSGMLTQVHHGNVNCNLIVGLKGFSKLPGTRSGAFNRRPLTNVNTARCRNSVFYRIDEENDESPEHVE